MAKAWIRRAAPLLPMIAMSSYAVAQSTAPAAPIPMPTPAPTMQPLPATLSEQARTAITTGSTDNPNKMPSLADQRKFIDQYQQTFGALQRKKYAVDISESTMGGVKVRLIRKAGTPATSKRVFLNLHGGGFVTDSGSLTENIPIAALTGVPVVAVLYRQAPESPFPAQADDALAVYRELLKTHAAKDIGIYGTSAGAILGPELLMRIRAAKLPMPSVLGVFSGDLDLSRRGDSILANKSYEMLAGLLNAFYLPKGQSAADPMVSPILGDLKGFPPTMCMTSSRDVFVSSTSNFCLALEEAGVENKLVSFDGLPHAFWAYIDAPESDRAFKIQARFLLGHLGR
ncbi:alpha/beta hydrolase [Sphingomonas panacisoli]|nr:alpha/beta hydrolase fold domain-containing protein [Sphingomonas panacisoli]